MKLISLSSYGLFLFSPNAMKNFLSKKRHARKKNLLKLFESNDSLYIESIKCGAWLPISEIPAINYPIFFGENPDHEALYLYKGFNLEVGDDHVIWISSIDTLYNFDMKNFSGEEISYTTLDGDTLTSAFSFKIKKGKYCVDIKGIRAKHSRQNTFGFSFDFNCTQSFKSYKNPRDLDKYIFYPR